MDLGWAACFQAIIIAACAWYQRNGSKRDAQQVIRSSAAQSTSDDILSRVTKIELAQTVMLKNMAAHGLIDDRAPMPTKKET